MNRRTFLERFAVAAASLSLGASLLSDCLTAKVPKAEKTIHPRDSLQYQPGKYKGEWKWSNQLDWADA